MAISLVLALLLSTGGVRAQFGGACDGSTVPDVAALAAVYPPTGQIAQIVAGDTVARNLFNSIQIPAFQPSTLVNGAPSDAGYNNGADPQCWWTYSQCHQSKIAGIPTDAYYCQPNSWGLTFDDGPTCFHAPLYAMLQQARQQATLFFIGQNVASYPNEARLAYNQGHIICVHTWSHHYTTSLTNEQIFAELYYTKKIIKDVVGVTPRCWRPPYGDVDDRVRAIANALELWTMGWNADSFDWSATTQGPAASDQDYTNIINGDWSQAGPLVLTHEVSAITVQLFQQHFAAIQQRFQHVVAASTCYNVSAPYAEPNAPIYQNWAQQIANPQLQTLQAPQTAATSGSMFFSGQAAFLASLNGTNIAPVASSVSSSVMPSSTSIAPVASSSAAAPSHSAAASMAPVVFGNSPNWAAIIGAAAGGIAAAILLAVGICLWRKRASRSQKHRQYNLDRSLTSPDSLYKEKFASSDTALLSPKGGSFTRSSTSDLNLPGFDYNHRLLSSSSLDVSRPFEAPPRPYSDHTPPISPQAAAFEVPSPRYSGVRLVDAPAARTPFTRPPSRQRQSVAGGLQYISQG